MLQPALLVLQGWFGTGKDRGRELSQTQGEALGCPPAAGPHSQHTSAFVPRSSLPGTPRPHWHRVPSLPSCAAPQSPRLTIRLPVRVVDVDVHGAVQSADQQRLVGTRGLVGSVDGFGLPVGPINVILKEGECKDVRDILAQHCVGERAAQQGAACSPPPAFDSRVSSAGSQHWELETPLQTQAPAQNLRTLLRPRRAAQLSPVCLLEPSRLANSM